MPNDESSDDQPDFNELGDMSDAEFDHAALILPKGEDYFFVNALSEDGTSAGVYKYSLDVWDDVIQFLDDRDVEYDIYEGD